MKNKKIKLYVGIAILVVALAVLGYKITFDKTRNAKTNNTVINTTINNQTIHYASNETIVSTVNDIELSDKDKTEYNGYVGRVALHWLNVVDRLGGKLSDDLPTDAEKINIAIELAANDDAENYEKNVNYNDTEYKANIDYAISRVQNTFGVTIDKNKLGKQISNNLFTLLPPMGFDYPIIYKTRNLTLDSSTGIYSLYFVEINKELHDTNYDRYMELANDDVLEYSKGDVSNFYVLKFKNINDKIVLISLNKD